MALKKKHLLASGFTVGKCRLTLQIPNTASALVTVDYISQIHLFDGWYRIGLSIYWLI